ncbi:MAG: histidine phosphatase family protein [Gammaproteobacteria bacterium]|nr:histidine phosphatase family protein [Gammaproteobacteria bacterium]
MSVELLLLRHGHSTVSPPVWDDRGDFGRQLSERGEQQAMQAGQWIRNHHLLPDAVVSSPAVRTEATAKAVCVAASLDQSIIHFEDSIYEAEVHHLGAIICQTSPQLRRLLLVGHNPGLEMLARQLVGIMPKSITGEVMPPATLVHIVLDGEWHRALEANAHCQQVFRPDLG